MNSFFEVLVQNILDSSWLEIIAAFFGLVSVWYAKKANILVYPTGIISVLLYVYICFNAQLYADMGINAFYFLMSVYGWIMWTIKTSDKMERQVTFMNLNNYLVSILIFAASLGLIIFLLRYFKNDDIAYWSSGVPYVDTFTTAVFVVGMWLLALKKVENWIFWIIGDVISVPLYFYKDLVFTSLQFFIFLILAVMGYIEWKKLAKQNQLA
ncbi:MAG TPA: nicotinamide riboside transporter PnuC [Bacteroidales bacterium]